MSVLFRPDQESAGADPADARPPGLWAMWAPIFWRKRHTPKFRTGLRECRSDLWNGRVPGLMSALHSLSHFWPATVVPRSLAPAAESGPHGHSQSPLRSAPRTASDWRAGRKQQRPPRAEFAGSAVDSRGVAVSVRPKACSISHTLRARQQLWSNAYGDRCEGTQGEETTRCA